MNRKLQDPSNYFIRVSLTPEGLFLVLQPLETLSQCWRSLGFVVVYRFDHSLGTHPWEWDQKLGVCFV